MDAAIFFSRGISKSGWILQLTLSEMFQLRLERESRRRSDKVIIKLTKSKLPKTFLRNGENKNRFKNLTLTFEHPLFF